MRKLASAFDFRGRTTRLGYWRQNLLFSILLGFDMVLTVASAASLRRGAAILLVPLPALIVAAVAVGVRRLHDRDRSGWWLVVFWLFPTLLSAGAQEVAHLGGPAAVEAALLSLPGLGLSLWGVVEMGFLSGSRGVNRFGDNPTAPIVEVFA
ncbi:DUF805 domain-containing protein [Phenylobacterium sp.]|uniref:DUF805 domain-containing protein n=1 Tax=Phenylobacterium sp. TaxID=1871053 RepID=UPI002F402DA6